MNTVQMAAKFYEARDTMRSFWTSGYVAQIDEYRRYLEAEMKAQNEGAVPACIKLCTRIKDMPNAGMSMALLMAATVEIVEPTNKSAVDQLGTEKSSSR